MSAHTKKLSQDFQIVQETLKSSNTVRLYQKGSFLGKGGFARVYEFINIESKRLFAGKVIEKVSLSKSRVRQKLMTEIKIHKSLNHPGIVKFEHFFEDCENVFILLELCQNHSLSELIRRRKRLTEIEVQCYLMQIIDALIYLHGQKVIHRDIKLGNLLLNEKMQVKLADFGLACKLEFEGERKNTICGTPNYIAPEIIGGGCGHSFEVDVWSLGVLAFTMLVGRPPFETSDVKDTYRRIKCNAYSFPEHVDLSFEAKELIIKILVLDPKERPTLTEIKNFRFFSKNPIPGMMPLSSLAIAPTLNFMKNFQKKDENITETSEKKSKFILNDLKTLPTPLEKPEEKENIEDPVKPREEKLLKPAATSRKSFVYSSFTGSEHGPTIFVKKWIDYSNKYGVAYLLNNKTIGIYFNDYSKLVSDTKGNSFKYHDRTTGEILFNSFEVPSELKKKIAILDHFRKYLNDEQESTGTLDVYVKKVIFTPHAVVLRLNNQAIQIRFLDKSEVFINGESKFVVFLNKHQVMQEFPLGSAFDSNCPDISKRLRYIKEVLTTSNQVT
jgi:polo-like kinase 1